MQKRHLICKRKQILPTRVISHLRVMSHPWIFEKFQEFVMHARNVPPLIFVSTIFVVWPTSYNTQIIVIGFFFFCIQMFATKVWVHENDIFSLLCCCPVSSQWGHSGKCLAFGMKYESLNGIQQSIEINIDHGMCELDYGVPLNSVITSGCRRKVFNCIQYKLFMSGRYKLAYLMG